MTNTKTSGLSDNELKIGVVFTPIKWGEFAIEKFDIFSKWMNGASVFDPTMGEGNLLESLITYGLSKGYNIDELPTQQLFGNELNTVFYNNARAKFKEKYDLDITNNFWNVDILKFENNAYDILFGNPPWQNFVDLPERYKSKIKSDFFKYDLIGDSQSLLLGGSRIDIAALIIQKSIKDLLNPKGDAYFFMPLSLLLNDGANRHFRTYKINDTKYAVRKVYDFNNLKIFNGISTRYGLVHFSKDISQTFPIDFVRYENECWKKYSAKPIFNLSDPLSILEGEENNLMMNYSPIKIKKESTPRQGVNTCGANKLFFFDTYKELNSKTCIVSNDISLPKEFVYPLLTSKNFKEKELVPYKWVLLPYSKSGKPLAKQELFEKKELFNYLTQHETQLNERKGTLIGAWFKRGYWWALLGVGPYNFFKYKIVWEAYGKNSFNPMLVSGEWQASQSLQSYIPVKTLDEAKRVLSELQNPAVETYLLSLKMEGTMNWAQPGKIKKLLQVE